MGEGLDYEEMKPEAAPKPEWVASFAGFPIYINPRLSPGWVEFHNANGEIIAIISCIGGSIHFGRIE